MKSNVMQYGKLLEFLKSRLYQGRLTVPKETSFTADEIPPDFLEYDFHQIHIRPVKKEEYAFTKDYMIKHFHHDAQVPKALKLGEYYKRHPLVGEEIDMMLHSGLSQIMRDTSSGHLVGICLSCFWRVDPNYDAFAVSAEDWLNAAGQIARSQATGGCDMEATMIFRDYQYQLLHHLFQRDAQKRGKKLIFYKGMQFNEEEYRHHHNFEAMTKIFLDHCPKDVLLAWMGTYHHYRGNWNRHLGSRLKELDFVPYPNLTFARKDGSKVFGNLEDQEGLTIHAVTD